ncbi:hypothetical protein J1605_021598 [Eschrichtius robustus]|uniref:Uncharacterized protein n=1 Tax=Eschrichtius robustus TaxID=9764 RepID=A0AB34HGJ3_ESCRO|nr:hypothetical protein J1605_021598 [Eschrichtius robustus]
MLRLAAAGRLAGRSGRGVDERDADSNEHYGLTQKKMCLRTWPSSEDGPHAALVSLAGGALFHTPSPNLPNRSSSSTAQVRDYVGAKPGAGVRSASPGSWGPRPARAHPLSSFLIQVLAALCGPAALTPSPPLQPSTKASLGSTTSSHLDHGHVTSPACPFLIFFVLWLEGSNVPAVHELSTQLRTARGPPPAPRGAHHAQLGQPTEKFHGKNRDSANPQGVGRSREPQKCGVPRAEATGGGG